MGYYTPRKFWFGTAPFVSPTPNIPSDPGKMQWIDAPVQGADLSSSDWGSSNTFLNGGAHVSQSRGSHKTYSFEWRASTAPETAALLQGYRSGVQGRGLINFLTPDVYETNALPERWAYPAISLGLEGRHLPVFKKTGTVYQLAQSPAVTGVATPQNEWNLPLTTARFDLSSAPLQPDTLGVRDSGLLFVPIPPGHYAVFNAWGSEGGYMVYTSQGGTPVYRPFNPDSYEDSGLLSSVFPALTNLGGLYLGLATETDALSVSALSVRVYSREMFEKNSTPEGVERLLRKGGVWHPGMGSSGTRFAPGGLSMSYNSPIGPGRMSVAASFTEVGDSLR